MSQPEKTSMKIYSMNNLSENLTVSDPHPLYNLLLATLVSGLLFFIFRHSLQAMYVTWMNVEEYSHGFFIPIISIYFIWIRRSELEPAKQLKEALPGIICVMIGLLFFMLGNLATLKTIEQYAFVLTFSGIILTVFGFKSLRVVWVPLFFLLFMVPFPAFILNNLSSKLQLISSWLGVEFIKACNIMVYLQGNVIDLGSYKLQVVDACSGLRYLFPLTSLSFLCAYLFRGHFWQKVIVFVSSIPLTIFMNSFRIGVIGVLVDNWGNEMAEGFLHDFEGWIIFVFCMALLFVEMYLFAWMNGKKTSLGDLVQIPAEWGQKARNSILKTPFKASWTVVLLLMSGGAIASQFLAQRTDFIPERKFFLHFPEQVGEWQGAKEYLAQNFLDALQLTDYIIVNYRNEVNGGLVNFYTAYYESQRRGVSTHSPKACLPGDGWRISDLRQLHLPDVYLGEQALRLNRTVIEKGENKQLVYYWFYERGRVVTNEYLVKLYLFYDAITMNRTDGSLIRLVTRVEPGEDVEIADQRLQGFLKQLTPELSVYLPEG